MCECGCGERTAPVFTFEGPPGITYGVALYPGCNECSTPAGVMLYAIPDSERKHFMLDDPDLSGVKAAPWVPLYGWREINIPVIDQAGLLAAMRERLGEHPEDYDGEGALEEAAPAFVEAASKSFHEFMQRGDWSAATPEP